MGNTNMFNYQYWAYPNQFYWEIHNGHMVYRQVTPRYLGYPGYVYDQFGYVHDQFGNVYFSGNMLYRGGNRGNSHRRGVWSSYDRNGFRGFGRNRRRGGFQRNNPRRAAPVPSIGSTDTDPVRISNQQGGNSSNGRREETYSSYSVFYQCPGVGPEEPNPNRIEELSPSSGSSGSDEEEFEDAQD
ncbi:uncharacterized protein LOC108039676 [Drosophila rhopaloa]|uniref:Uncharacterized protein n=1 Tax=Drosophila rhopaloa TaxID=1041015 RepID=A0ABM5GZK8_DRORH|nr:uncharacterized protein LOC108039676 [Drosophila rhopaloa]